MNRYKRILICIAVAVILMAAAIGIGIAISMTQSNNPPDSHTHKHSYATEVIPATCGHGGYTLHSCECGDSYRTDDIPPLSHEYGEWETTIEASVDNEGQRVKNCLHCNEGISEVIPKLEAHEHIYEHETILPTCTDKGYTLHTCTVCGYTESDADTDATGHSWSAWEEVKAATETETGEKKRSCKTCSETESAVIPKIIPSHTHTYTETVVAPTCTEAGYTLHSCECGKSYTSNEVSKIGHLYGNWETTKQPTTTETGERQCVCSRCGHVNIESIDKLTTEQENAYTSYIDPRITIEHLPDGAVAYCYLSLDVVDTRSWGTPPTIRIMDNGSFHIVYYQKDGTKVTFSLNPVEGYANSFVIFESGSYSTQLTGDYKD